MQIIVKRHAIDQYRNKNFDKPGLTDEEIRDVLRNIALKGNRDRRRPAFNKRTYAVKYRGQAVVTVFYPNKAVVITFLGDETYQKWFKKQEIDQRRLAG